MLKVVEEAKTILLSERDEFEHPIWASKSQFLENYPFLGEYPVLKDDEKYVDLMALVVLDDFPVEVCRSKRLALTYKTPR